MKETAELALECFLCAISFLMIELSSTVADRAQNTDGGSSGMRIGWLQGIRKVLKLNNLWLRWVDLLPSRALIPRNLLIVR